MDLRAIKTALLGSENKQIVQTMLTVLTQTPPSVLG
jgi:hypothetical protein